MELGRVRDWFTCAYLALVAFPFFTPFPLLFLYFPSSVLTILPTVTIESESSYALERLLSKAITVMHAKDKAIQDACVVLAGGEGGGTGDVVMGRVYER